MRNLVATEWLKVRTVRLLVVAVPLAVLLAVAAVAGMVLAADGPDLESTTGIERVFSVTGAGAVVMLIVGILISAGEFRHGTATDTFLATPRRSQVLQAKLTLGAGLGAGVGLLTAVAGIAVAAVLYPARSATLPVDSVDVLLALPASVVYASLFAVLGVAIGALLRDQVLAIAVTLGWIALVEHILVTLAPAIGRWLPLGAGQAVLRTPLDDLLSPVMGGLVLGAYAAAFAALVVMLEGRRDV
jgi:ABC-2 type transport system permease protein